MDVDDLKYNDNSNNIDWLPKHFVLTHKTKDRIYGFVRSQEQVASLLRLHSENTYCVFARKLVDLIVLFIIYYY